uniref:Testis cDNA, clone: QtsA-14950 n=1 Tax=Macaca fascicularis TaxID=9541 RepID=A5LFW9_MACFA|nr:unnamed protein product [Macaca fascicularis]
MQYCPDGRLLTSPISSLVLSRALEGAAIPDHLSSPLLIHPSIHPSIHPPTIFSSPHSSHHLSIHPSPNHLPFLQGDSRYLQKWATTKEAK